MSTTELTPEMEALKTRLKATWEAGDYCKFAKFLEPPAIEFFESLNIEPGTRLLDIACGAGQLTLPAARKGIDVTAIDLAQNLVDEANSRAQAEGFDLEIVQGDAEDLPFSDSSFDAVLSLFGAMFAPRPELVASEMVRVCRPGGRIMMGNWTPEGHIGQMFKVIGSHFPPPAIFPSPLLWGKEDVVRERFGDGVSELNLEKRMHLFSYPFPPAEVVEIYMTLYGPTVRAYAALDDVGKAALRSDLEALWTRNNDATDGTTKVLSEYLVVDGTTADPDRSE